MLRKKKELALILCDPKVSSFAPLKFLGCTIGWPQPPVTTSLGGAQAHSNGHYVEA